MQAGGAFDKKGYEVNRKGVRVVLIPFYIYVHYSCGTERALGSAKSEREESNLKLWDQMFLR